MCSFSLLILPLSRCDFVGGLYDRQLLDRKAVYKISPQVRYSDHSNDIRCFREHSYLNEWVSIFIKTRDCWNWLWCFQIIRFGCKWMGSSSGAKVDGSWFMLLIWEWPRQARNRATIPCAAWQSVSFRHTCKTFHSAQWYRSHGLSVLRWILLDWLLYCDNKRWWRFSRVTRSLLQLYSWSSFFTFSSSPVLIRIPHLPGCNKWQIQLFMAEFWKEFLIFHNSAGCTYVLMSCAVRTCALMVDECTVQVVGAVVNQWTTTIWDIVTKANVI